MRSTVVACWIAAFVSACVSEAPPPPARPPAAAAPVAKAPEPASLPAGHLARSAVDAVVTKNGPPWLLSRVSVEETLKDGKFVGWRLMAMPKEWDGIDLKPGDVVMRVNGMTIEKPEDLWTAWTSLVVASDLKIAYERDGASREVVFHIEGDPAKEVPAAMREDAPPPPAAKPKRGGTIVIVGDDGTSASDE